MEMNKSDKFYIRRKKPIPGSKDAKGVIRVSPETYNILREWALASYKTIGEMANEAIAYAAKHAELIDE